MMDRVRERRRRRLGPLLDTELLGQDLKEHLGRLDSAMRDLVGGAGTPEGFDPERFLAPGVPRIRPILVLLSARAAAAARDPSIGPASISIDDDLAAEHLAVAAELLHLAIVIHDAALGRQGGRRRRAALRLIGGAAAWLGGNHLTLRALELARHAPSPEVIGDMLEAMREIADGHALAQALEGRIGTVPELFDLAEGRSGAVFSFACRAGARLVRADRPTLTGLGRYGRHAGVAWQLAEDLAAFESDDDEELGRQVESRAGRPGGNLAISLAVALDPELAGKWNQLGRQGDPLLAVDIGHRVQDSGALLEGRRHVAREAWAARRALHQLPSSPSREVLDHIVAALAISA